MIRNNLSIFKAFTFPSILVIALSACAPAPTLYYWGEYENLLYQTYIHSGSINATDHIALLQTDIEKAEVAKQQIAPGIYAHLGYLYYNLGQVDQAEAAFKTEKKIYPESERLMDSLLSGVQR